DLHKRTNGDTFVLIGLLDGWRKDIEIGLDAYFTTNAEVIRRAMDRTQAWPPIQAWLLCYLPSMAGIPGDVTQAGCKVGDQISRIRANVDAITRAVKDFDPVGRMVRAELDRLKDQVEELAKNEVRSRVLHALGPELRALVTVLTERPDGEALRREFTSGAG